MRISDEEFARYIDEKAAEYERIVDNLDMPLKADTVGTFLAPLIRAYLEARK